MAVPYVNHEFTYWSKLPVKIRQNIIQYLDYLTRIRLSRCSKEDKETVNGTPLPIYGIRCYEEPMYYENRKTDMIEIILQVEKYEKVFVRCMFLDFGNNTQLQSRIYDGYEGVDKEKHTIKYNSNYRQLAFAFIEKHQQMSSNYMKGFQLIISDYKWFNINNFTNLKSFYVTVDSNKRVEWWFDKLQVNKSLQLLHIIYDKYTVDNKDFEVFPSRFIDTETVMNAENLYIWGNVHITDKQFLSIKSKQISISTDTISSSGFNQFIKRWMNRRYADDFENCIIWTSHLVDHETIMKDINARLWDDSFQKDTGELVKIFQGSNCIPVCCYQIARIDGKQSASIHFEELRVIFQVTAHLIESNENKSKWNGYYGYQLEFDGKVR